MMALLTVRWSSLIAGIAFLIIAMLGFGFGCGRPTDEAWLRFIGFRTSDGKTSIAVLNGDLNEDKDDTVGAAFKNTSITVNTTSGSTGTGIFISNARIDYKMSGYSPPFVEYPLNLYLVSSTVATGAVTSNEVLLTDLPLATTTLKTWLIATNAFDDPDSTPAVNLTAFVTFSAITDEGARLEVSGSIAISLTTTGTSGSSKTVNVSATTSTASLGVPGVFTVSRTSGTATDLTVYYEMSGTAVAGDDYEKLDGYVVIPSGSSDATVSVTPIDGFTDGETVIVTLTEKTTYTVGSRPKATVTLKL